MRRDERGMVTAELALGLLTVLVLGLAAAWAAMAGVQQVAAGDLAAQVARQLARGDAEAAARLTASQPGAEVLASTSGGLVMVTVRLPGRGLGALPPLPAKARATAALEPVP